MKKILIVTFALSILCSCNLYNKPIDMDSVKIDTLQGKSLLGKDLVSQQVNPKQDSLQIANYFSSLLTYNSNPMNADFIIWLGRRQAYLGDYKAAIGIFNEGILKFPDDARFYRHRGHRYISIRKLDSAIVDFEKASELIQDTEDVIEPDGIPNKLNQPVSSLHTNIWYHLGLAYYLQDDLENALNAFQDCLSASKNDDMVVATSHWLYMILRRLNNVEEANQLLEHITANMVIIENDAYHKLLLYYKGEIDENDLDANTSLGSSEAAQYGIANWHHYNGDIETAKAKYEYLVKNGNWAGFGYIAAEADLSRIK
jgi:tetratricopeptide (TPR) repeat protein